jgi:type IV pilus assembly protein PilW
MIYRSTRGRTRPWTAERGYSLVEMMVAIAVALFLLAGMVSILQTTRRSSGNQTALTQLQDSERIAMTMLSSSVEAAGYYPDPDTNSISDELAAEGNFQVGQVVFGGPNAVTINGNSTGDILTVRYNAGPNEDVINCQGATNATGTGPVEYVNTFAIQVDANNVPYLGCSTDGGNTYAPLATNVSKMEISYGVGTASTIPNTTGIAVDTYLATADMVNAGQLNPYLWTNVYSIKVTLTFPNPMPGQPGASPRPIQFTRVIGIMSRIGVNVVSFQ